MYGAIHQISENESGLFKNFTKKVPLHKLKIEIVEQVNGALMNRNPIPTNFFCTTILAFGLGFFSCAEASLATYGSNPLARASSSGERKADVIHMAEGVRKALAALQEDPFSAASVWDLSLLQRNPALTQKLKSFLEGKVGAYLRTLDTKNTTYQAIREELLQKGFVLTDVPLMAKRVRHKAGGRKVEIQGGRYILQNGSQTHDRNDPFLAVQEMYVHPDGSLVRIKVQGEPGGKRPQPHIIKAVLFDPAKGTGYNNEAFKITWNGKAVPKGPNKEFGFKTTPSAQSSEDEVQGWTDAIMQEAHCDLKQGR